MRTGRWKNAHQLGEWRERFPQGELDVELVDVPEVGRKRRIMVRIEPVCPTVKPKQLVARGYPALTTPRTGIRGSSTASPSAGLVYNIGRSQRFRHGSPYGRNRTLPYSNGPGTE